MTRAQGPELVLLPSLAAQRGPGGRLHVTRKYLDGAAEFAQSWPGPVTSLLEVTDQAGSDMDPVEIAPDLGDPGIEFRPTERTALARRLKSAAVVLGHLSPRERGTAELCHAMGVPIFFTSEYTPRTEGQIVDANTRNPILRLRRKHWLRGAETTRRHILRHYATGLQCSGTPTHDLYRPLVPDAHLFFDNRVRAAHVISDDELAAKCARLTENHPLRLVFGGRLVAMKGVLDLPRVARALIAQGLPFTFDIVGEGPLEAQLGQEIAALGDDRVRLHPAMDFRSGWVPFLRERADLFLCCHPQGDPSSTYPEVMSCGVPVIGYDNEAWTGVLRCSEAGWSVPMGDSAGIARQVAQLHDARGQIVGMARRGRTFAALHCFEKTFARRTAHLAGALRDPGQVG